MLVSHKHKFVFIHIPKTAGSSVTVSLKNLGQDDAKSSYQHITCQNLKKIFDNQRWTWSDYFKFSFVRNPFARIVSEFHYVKDGHNKNRKKYKFDFKKFICKKYFETHVWHHHADPQLNFISLNKKIEVDFIGRVENLQQDLNIICDKIGIPRQELPHYNKTEHKHYTEYYDDETRQLVAEKYAKDIEYFGYEFGKD